MAVKADWTEVMQIEADKVDEAVDFGTVVIGGWRREGEPPVSIRRLHDQRACANDTWVLAPFSAIFPEERSEARQWAQTLPQLTYSLVNISGSARWSALRTSPGFQDCTMGFSAFPILQAPATCKSGRRIRFPRVYTCQKAESGFLEWSQKTKHVVDRNYSAPSGARDLSDLVKQKQEEKIGLVSSRLKQQEMDRCEPFESTTYQNTS